MSEKIEGRKRLNFGARFIITMFIVSTFLVLVWLLFYVELPQASRDLINIMVGAYVAVLAKRPIIGLKKKKTQNIKNQNLYKKMVLTVSIDN